MEAAESTPSMIDSRSNRRTLKFSAICRITSITAALPRRAPKNGNMSIGPWRDHSTSSSIKASISSNWRSLIARCIAREKRQRLCSVIWVVPELAGGQQTAHRRRQRRRGGVLHFISLLKGGKNQSGQTAIAIFALHKCGGSATSAVAAVPELAFDGDLGIAQGDQAESQRAAQPADGGAERH